MDKVKHKIKSLKYSFFIYLLICFLFAFFGSMGIGLATNELQSWYKNLHSDVQLIPPPYDSPLYIFFEEEENHLDVKYIVTDSRPFADKKYVLIYFIISSAQFIIIPFWIFLNVALTGMIFYRHELKKPIEILLDASRKISENQLDFNIEYVKKNELGQLCTAFNNMRKALDKNNREMWHSLEERKRLNSAFSHDLRTPLTVLRGYNDFLEKYSGKLTEEKTSEILFKMKEQINRLENYTYKMSALHKLEDIIPDIEELRTDILKENFAESGKYICTNKHLILNFKSDSDYLFIDKELIMEVYENILSNAERYADSKITVNISVIKNFLKITVQDDGMGFTDKALQSASEPFYRDEKKQNSMHFGLGLYICRIICEKCGGKLDISNTKTGGKVTAIFFCENI